MRYDEGVQIKEPVAARAGARRSDVVGKTRKRSSRRRKKLLRFIVLETFALVVLVLAVIAGTSSPFAKENMTLPFAITVFVAAAAIVIIPIIFYGLPRRQHGRYR
jgi:hypothetical protein